MEEIVYQQDVAENKAGKASLSTSSCQFLLASFMRLKAPFISVQSKMPCLSDHNSNVGNALFII